MNSIVFWDVTQGSLVSLGRLGTTFSSHLQGSNCPRKQPTLHNIPIDERIRVNRSGSLRFRTKNVEYSWKKGTRLSSVVKNV
jgi:hypothetical protein